MNPPGIGKFPVFPFFRKGRRPWGKVNRKTGCNGRKLGDSYRNAIPLGGPSALALLAQEHMSGVPQGWGASVLTVDTNRGVWNCKTSFSQNKEMVRHGDSQGVWAKNPNWTQTRAFWGPLRSFPQQILPGSGLDIGGCDTLQPIDEISMLGWQGALTKKGWTLFPGWAPHIDLESDKLLLPRNSGVQKLRNRFTSFHLPKFCPPRDGQDFG